MLRWGPSTGPTRSDGLSVRRFMAMAHSSTVWIRCLTVLAMTGLVCQMGVRIASTSALATSEIGRRPMRGNA